MLKQKKLDRFKFYTDHYNYNQYQHFSLVLYKSPTTVEQHQCFEVTLTL